MTSNKTTELLREGLTERGIEWRSWLEGVTLVGDWCFVEYDNGKLAATCEPVLTPEQVIAVMLGDDDYEYRMDELLCRLTNGKWSKSRSYTVDFMVSCVDEAYEDATLGGGNLTAEQVRKAIFNGSAYASYDGSQYYANGIGMQAIADELNAALGGEECELIETDSYSNANEVVHTLECSACGKSCEHVNGSYPRCPFCGAKEESE